MQPLRLVHDQRDARRARLVLGRVVDADALAVHGGDRVLAHRQLHHLVEARGGDALGVVLVDLQDHVVHLVDALLRQCRDGDDRGVVEELEAVAHLLDDLVILLLGSEVPFVQDDEAGEAVLVDQAGDLLVEVDEGVARVEDEQGDVGFVEHLLRAHQGELLDAEDLAPLADPRRVDEGDRLPLVLDAFVDRVDRRSRRVADDGALLLQQGVEQGALADVDPADDGDAHPVGGLLVEVLDLVVLPVYGVLVDLLLVVELIQEGVEVIFVGLRFDDRGLDLAVRFGKAVGDPLQQGVDVAVVGDGDAEDVVGAELVVLPEFLLHLVVVDFVDDEGDLLAHLLEFVEELLVLLLREAFAVDHKEDDVRLAGRFEGFFADAVVEFAPRVEAAGIEDLHLLVEDGGDAALDVAGGAGHFGGDGVALFEQSVEE